MVISYDSKAHRYSYRDRNGKPIEAGDYVIMNGKVYEVYSCIIDNKDEGLGTDATNPAWIASGRAEPCEYGIYKFEVDDEPIKCHVEGK